MKATQQEYNILVLGDPKLAKEFFLHTNFLAETDYRSDETMHTLIIEMGSIKIYLHNFRDESYFTDHEIFSNLDGGIAVFEYGDKQSFDFIPLTLTKLIRQSERIVPVYVVGLKSVPVVYSSEISSEDVLEYLYTLGNVCACMIPYIELEKADNTTLTEIFVDLLKLIKCEHKDNCGGKPAILRRQCGIKQYKSNFVIPAQI